MTFDELNEQLPELLAAAREQGRQEERRRLQRASPVTVARIRRIITQHVDPAPELAELMGAEVSFLAGELEQVLGVLDRVAGSDLVTHSTVVGARAALMRAARVLGAPAAGEAVPQ